MTRSKFLVRGSFVMLLLAGLVAGILAPMMAPVKAAPQNLAATHVVISQFRTSGPSGGNDEFIEFFNPTNASVIMSGWQVNGSNSTGGISTRYTFPAGKTLLPSQHYLITNNSTNGYSGTVVGDDTFSMSITDTGGIALIDPANPTAPVDQVGMSTGSAYKEGTVLSPLSGNLDQSYERYSDANGSCIDTDNNSTDFFLLKPSDPLNSSSPVTTCTDATPPAVTVNKTLSQASSTSTLPINFSVVFSEPINAVTFTTADITQTGTATSTGITWSIIDSGDHTNFTLSATVVTGSGTIVPFIAANTVTDSNGYGNTASTSTDNTVTFTLPPQPTPCPITYHSLLINEVGWMGTKASSSDEWIELYNPSACTVDLTNWTLIGTYYYTTNNTITFPATTSGPLTIAPGGYFVIAVNSGVFQNLTPNLYVSNLSLLNSYQALRLVSPGQTTVDTANNLSNYNWPAGSASPNYASMERYHQSDDGPGAWVTFAGPTGLSSLPAAQNIKDRNGNYVQGTPGGPNWANTVTITPSPAPTATKRVTPIPPTPFAHVVINEFLPRAGFDWNNDGLIDTNDEFIEIENLGPINVSLSGWKLSDDPNIGGKTFSLPSQTLQPGQRAVFYGSTTHIVLVDSGDTIRLINTRGVIVDARGYGVVKYPDQSHCRIPDGDGYWQLDCFPTPGNENKLTGTLPFTPPIKIDQSAPCLLPDTTPAEFRLAVCNPFGADISNSKYWDDMAGQKQFVIFDPFSKGEVIVK